MSTQVGAIYLDASIDTSKFKRDAKEIDSTAEQTGRNIENSTERGTSVAGAALGKLARLAKFAAIAVGAAATAAIGKFVVMGGISRALNIEDAQAKLKGLGHDAKSVEKIMGSALKSVKGTAYGLDAAATTAASAVAAGIKPGKELTKYLTLTADAATIAGIGMDEMGSIMNKVTTSGKAMTDNLNQLSDRGIPIFQWLQEEYKVSAEELSEMVSDGEVDAETFRKVIAENIGGAALESGKTTRGAWENMKAAMARVGEAIVKDIIPKVRDGFNSITTWFDNNKEGIVASVGGIVTNFMSLGTSIYNVAKQVGDYLMPKFQELMIKIGEAIPKFQQFWTDTLQPLATMFGTTLVVGIGATMDVLGWLVTFISDHTWIVTALGTAFVFVKTAMFLQGAINAFTGVMVAVRAQAALTAGAQGIGGMTRALKVFSALAGVPISLPALVITAALLSIAALVAAVVNAKRVIDGIMREAQGKIDETSRKATDAAKAFNKAPTAQNKASLKKNVRADYLMQKEQDGLTVHNAGGTDNWRGGPTWVGEEGPEILNLPKGSKITPNDESMAIAGGSKSEWNIGNIYISNEVDGEKWLQRLTKNQEIVSVGLVPTQKYMGA